MSFENANPDTNGQPTNDSVKKTLEIMGWILVFFPLLGLLEMWISLPSFMGLAPWLADKYTLKQYGYDGKWTWWGLLALPVYLYFRCKKIDGNYNKFFCSIITALAILIISFLIPLMQI